MTRVIGSQSDVPDIGDPIVSPWYQDTAKKIVHTFATSTARDAWTDPPNGAVCVTVDTSVAWIRKAGVWVILAPPGVGQSLEGSCPGGDVAPATTIQTASLTLPGPAKWLINYNLLLNTASGGIACTVRLLVGGANYLNNLVRFPAPVTHHSATLIGLAVVPGTSAVVACQVYNEGTVTLSTYSDPLLHRLVALQGW